MNFKEIKSAIDHLRKTCKCQGCNQAHKDENIQIIATTTSEALFEMICKKCKTSTYVTVVATPEVSIKEEDISNRTHRRITPNDVLDVKNFLSNFNGDFKTIFTKKK